MSDITEFEKYGFEQTSAGTAVPYIGQCFRYIEEPLLVVQLTQDVQLPQLKEINLQKVFGCYYVLTVYESQEEVKVSFLSETREIRALEFLDYMLPEFGLIKGEADSARGQISSVILKVKMASKELDNILEYFLYQTDSYFGECQCIDASTFAETEAEELGRMVRYKKRKTGWAYVKSTEVAQPGQQLCVKSLENEGGVVITAAEDAYIMIGCRGEVYDITREKFESTYEASDEPLDIFEQMLDFIPTIETVPQGEYMSIDELAHVCYPKGDSAIYACPLDHRIKVFPVNGNQEYFFGRPGDYLAIREDDRYDIYVIQKDIFAQTYEPSEE